MLNSTDLVNKNLLYGRIDVHNMGRYKKQGFMHEKTGTGVKPENDDDTSKLN